MTQTATKELPLAEELHDILKECPYTKNYKLSVLELPHAVVIGGTVSCFYHKQMAQEAAVKWLQPKVKKGLMLMLKNEIVVSEPKEATSEDRD